MMTEKIADDFPSIARRMKELAEQPMEAGTADNETAVNPKTGKRYRWTGQQWVEEEELPPPVFSFMTAVQLFCSTYGLDSLSELQELQYCPWPNAE